MDKVVGDFSYEGVAAIPIGEDMREWKVYFDNNFWGQPKGARAGTEIRLDREFDWAGYHWVVPAHISAKSSGCSWIWIIRFACISIPEWN